MGALWRRLKYLIGWLYLRGAGWKIGPPPPAIDKYLIVGHPHTSNWDVPVMLALEFVYDVRVFWLGKHTLFRPPLGRFMRFLGGIPIDRTSHRNYVEQIADEFRRAKQMALVVTPQGTRKRVEYWKSGFYWIAMAAKLPLTLAYMDWGTRETGFGPTFMPSGDLDADMKLIAEFYKDKVGKYPDQTTPPRVRPRESAPLPGSAAGVP